MAYLKALFLVSKSWPETGSLLECPMPFALFCQDSKISRAFDTKADVWKHALENGLVVDMSSDEESPSPQRVLDNGYTIHPCAADPVETHDPNATDIALLLPS